jgi:phage protein U
LEAIVLPDNEPLQERWVYVGQNPVIHQIDLQLFGKQGEEITLTLLNLQGQTIQQKSLKPASNQQQESLNVSSLHSGMYLLKVINEGKIKTFKILKTE